MRYLYFHQVSINASFPGFKTPRRLHLKSQTGMLVSPAPPPPPAVPEKIKSLIWLLNDNSYSTILLKNCLHLFYCSSCQSHRRPFNDKKGHEIGHALFWYKWLTYRLQWLLCKLPPVSLFLVSYFSFFITIQKRQNWARDGGRGSFGEGVQVL